MGVSRGTRNQLAPASSFDSSEGRATATIKVSRARPSQRDTCAPLGIVTGSMPRATTLSLRLSQVPKLAAAASPSSTGWHGSLKRRVATRPEKTLSGGGPSPSPTRLRIGRSGKTAGSVTL
ncbi:MAG: hypothetical protein U1F43_20650 [Myxococcota bacterium]